MATRPPSPATSGLVGVRLNTSAMPNEPIGTPLTHEPSACAASNMTGMPCARPSCFERAHVARRTEHVGGHDRARTVESCCAACVGIDLERVRQALDEARDVRPFHMTACADAENVKLGSTTGPGRPSVSACTTSIRPEVHELSATTCETPRRSAMRASSSSTSGPLVSMPRLYEGSSRRITRSSGGRAGRANGRPGAKAAGPPSNAGRCVGARAGGREVDAGGVA